MTAIFTYHLVEAAGGRAAAYQRGGNGPAVVLLHESPRSSGAVMPLAERLARRYTVFAIDTPGFGLSDALPVTRPSADDFAFALAQTLDAIGIARAPVYGTHTGAVIAIAYGLKFPERTSALVLDGFPVFTPQEQEESLASYLTPFAVDWEGTHLAWLTSRVKDQFTVFPWYRRGQSARLPWPLASVTLINQVIVDLMSAGNSYRDAYASAFRFVAHEPAARVTVPTAIMARSDDLLFPHLERLTTLGPMVTVHRLGPDRGAWAAAIGDYFATADASVAPAVVTVPRVPTALSLQAVRCIIHVGDNSIGLRIWGNSTLPALLLLPPIPGAAIGVDAEARILSDTHRVFAVDLPGIGVSSPAAGIEAIAALLQVLASALQIDVAKVVAMGESCSIGVALAQLMPAAEVTLVDPIPDDTALRTQLVREMADVAPRLDGRHLHAAWHQLRDRSLWRPWIQRDPDHAIDMGTDPAPDILQDVLTEWLRGGAASRQLLASALAEPLQHRLTALGQRARIIALDGHPWREPSRALAETCKAKFVSRAGRMPWEPLA